MTTRIVHLSDLHFGAITPGMPERLLSKLHDVEPHMIVISGDLTQRARADEFREAAAFLQQLPCPYLVVPGNHDLAAFRLHERLIYPWHKWRKYINAELEPVVRGHGVIAIGLNTARRVSAHLDWSRGRINLRQLDRVKVEFSDSQPECLRLVVTHHPFYLSDEARHRGLIGRFRMAWPRLKAAGVDMILSGHLHLAYAQVFHGMIITHAGSGVSHRLKGEANSFNLICATKDKIEVQQMHFQGQGFSAGIFQCFSRSGDGFVETRSLKKVMPGVARQFR